jgi:hypothetical protein
MISFITKKQFYKKPLPKKERCHCCKFPGSIDKMGRRKWLSSKRGKYLDKEINKDIFIGKYVY